MEKYAVFFIACLLAYIIWDVIREIDARSEIALLKSELQNLEYCRGEMEKIFLTSPNAPFILDNEIRELNLRADTLKFCYQCPLYRGKVQENKQQTLKEQQE